MNFWKEIWEFVKLVILVAVITAIINHVVLINAKIPSESMENTIMPGDRIFGCRLSYGINLNLFGKKIMKKARDPKRFDIVIFRYPDNEEKLFIKRVIALPGEKIRILDGKVYINDSQTPLNDSFVPEIPRGNFGPYEVPEECYFMLGDNRNHSKDSRFWNHHFVRFDQIVGKAVFRYYPTIKILNNYT
ncbi:MAG: signal peptidase I [Blautia sp.]|nr:signal peptidase I [Clostridia bacterium]MDY4692498.1 signal peptidase I [Blautia sp.]MDY5554053.1 signal peptidase I [Blautia sp.]